MNNKRFIKIPESPIWKFNLSDPNVDFLGSFEKTKDFDLSEPTNLTDLAYETIKRKLQYCEYMPGEDLNEKQLNEEIGLGRTPIREAILLLKMDDLIEVFPRKGMRVKPIIARDIKNIFETRKFIEQNIITEFKTLYPKDTLLLFDIQFRDKILDTLDILRLDHSFYQYLIGITYNELLQALYGKLLEKSFRLNAYLSKLELLNVKDIVIRNRETIQAILSEDSSNIKEVLHNNSNNMLISSLKAVIE